jgi:hypothetical protein
MSSRTETAGKTAGTGAATRRVGRKSTLRARVGRGKYALLAAMAAALNAVSWAEKDNTAETIWREFRMWNERPAYWGYTLVETIDTGAEEMSDSDRKRKLELSDMLAAHGVAVAKYIA